MSHWIWRVLAWLIAVGVGAGVALWIYKKQSFKALSYQVVSISPLMPLQARGFSDLRVLKGDKPVERPFLTTIRIANTGDVSIAPADFVMPLTIRPIGSTSLEQVGGKLDWEKSDKVGISIFNVPYKGVAAFNPQVVDARVASTSPPKIPVDLEISNAQLRVRPLLLNGGDEVTVELLINGDVRGIELAGRIVGIGQITEEPQPSISSDPRQWSVWKTAGVIAALLLGVVVSIVLTYWPRKSQR